MDSFASHSGHGIHHNVIVHTAGISMGDDAKLMPWKLPFNQLLSDLRILFWRKFLAIILIPTLNDMNGA